MSHATALAPTAPIWSSIYKRELLRRPVLRPKESEFSWKTGLILFLSFFARKLIFDFPIDQVEGLRRVWHWKASGSDVTAKLSRSERRRLERQYPGVSTFVQPLRNFILLIPIVCVISLGLRVAGRLCGWSESIHGPDRDALLMNDWSLHRAELNKWVEQQPGAQLVFVRYSVRHNVFFEWVYNHADLVHSHVIWARDLGTQHDADLLKQFPDRTAWMIDADREDPQLVPYAQAGISNGFSPTMSSSSKLQSKN